MTLLRRSIHAIVLAAAVLFCLADTGGAVESHQQRGMPSTVAEQRPTQYSVLKGDVYVVYAQVIDYAEDNECQGNDCIPLPLLRLKVLTSFRGSWSGNLLLELPFLAQQPEHPEVIRKGDLLMVTFTKDAAPTMWSCGSLRACGGAAPKQVLRVVDLFRHVRWG
jgi:hypothetical protein